MTATSRRNSGLPDELVRRIEEWKRWYPDVPIFPIGHCSGIVRFLDDPKHDGIGCVVVGRSGIQAIGQIADTARDQTFAILVAG